MEDFYNVYKNDYKLMQGGSTIKYKCDPNKRFNKICTEANIGIYATKKECLDECQYKFIKKKLAKYKLKQETTIYYNFIQELIADGIDVYIKGGTVLGLYILHDIYTKSSNDFYEKFAEYLTLNLIRDWDFSCYIKDAVITEEVRSKLDALAKKHKLVSRAKTFILYRTKNPLMIDDMALFELAISEECNPAHCELPMTTIKIKITKDNIYQIFMLATCFYLKYSKNINIDIPFVKYAIKKINFIIPVHKNGMYVMKKIYSENISSELLHFIKDFSNNQLDKQQFLITHFIEPNRMFYRLLNKNLPKIIKINNFYKNQKISPKNIRSILPDPSLINNMINSFVYKLSKQLAKTKNLNDLFINVNLDRIRIEYNNIDTDGKKLIKQLFEPIYQNILKQNDNDQLNQLIKFLQARALFD